MNFFKYIVLIKSTTCR